MCFWLKKRYHKSENMGLDWDHVETPLERPIIHYSKIIKLDLKL